MSTLLQLVNKTKTELGIQGADLTAVTNQTGMAKRLVAWTIKADLFVQGLHTDWKFLWTQFSHNTVVDESLISPPANIGAWDVEKFWLNYTLATAQPLTFMQYREFVKVLGSGVKTNDTPDTITIQPDNKLKLDPPADGAYALTADYWKAPTILADKDDETVLPAQYEDIIIAKTKLYYAESEEDPAVYTSATKEYDAVLIELEALELPERERNNQTEAVELTVHAV